MQKKFLLPVALFAANAVAGSANLGIDARLGYLQNDNDFDKTGDAKESIFKVERFRLRSAGSFTDKLSYNFRLNLLSSYDEPAAGSAKTTNFIDLFALHHQLTPELKISFGKFITFIGGREWDYNGAEQYLYSYFGWNAPANRVGGQATYDWNKQVFTLQVTNGDESDNKRQQAYWLGWTGNLLDGKILPIVGYGYQKHGINDTGENQTSTYMTAGARFTYQQYELETDYLMYSSEHATTADKKDETNTMVVQARYRGECFRPLVKYSNDTVKISGTKAGVVDRYTAALEYYPDPAMNFRYHLAYTMDKAKSKSGDVDGEFDYDKSSIILGVRANLDFIKL